MIFSYNWLQSFFKDKLPEPRKLAELITSRFFEVEDVEKKDDDWIIDIDVLPNRASDCFSHIGISREISTMTNLEVNHNLYLNKLEHLIKKPQKFFSVKVENSKDCPRYTALLIQGIKVGSSPSWIRKRLEICGLQPINNIVDIVNYAMLETGQPMHAFDFDKISNNEIIVRKAKDKEKIIGLDKKEYPLNKNILVISDSKKILGIAGIKGGKNAEIDENTTAVVLESANFNRLIIRKSSKKLKLKTDASLRFEHGLDPNLTEMGIKKALSLIQEIAGGKAIELIDFYPEKIKKKKIKLDLEYLNNLLGKKISKNETKKTLSGLDFKIIKENQQFLEIEIPTQRLDVSFQEDLIEEIGRIHGYENIVPVLPKASIASPIKNKDLFWTNQAKEILKSANFTEIYNYSFISQEQSEIFNYNSENLFEVEMPKSLEQKYLRPSLVPHILKNVKKNQNSFKNFRIFEIGKVFEKKTEKDQLVGIITGNSFRETKGVVEVLLEKMGLTKNEFIKFKKELDFLHANKRAEIISNKKIIGFIGNVSYKILESLKIKSDVSIFVLDFKKVKEMASQEKIYQPIIKFPEITRDLAVLVPIKALFQEILETINKVKTPLIEKIALFDIYQGKEIPKNKKNFALRLTYRDSKKTLIAEEVNRLHQKIIKKIEENKNWQIRK